MSGPVMCECGAVLVAEATPNGIVTVEGEYVKFSRRTDFIACAACLRSYPAREILPEPEYDELLDDVPGDDA